ELQILENLNLRIKLTKVEQLNYQNLEKGYIGERKFAGLLDKHLTKSPILLYDLLFKINNTEFQIDCLPIFSNKIYHFEIKNFEGNFYYDKDNWYVVETKKEIRSPLTAAKTLSNITQRTAPQTWIQCSSRILHYFCQRGIHIIPSPHKLTDYSAN